jgi:ankyrin repeat protein
MSCKILLPDPNLWRMILAEAISWGDPGVLRQLIRCQCLQPKRRLPVDALHLAMRSPESGTATTTIALLIERGTDVNKLDTWGLTPFHLAALEGFAVYASVLLSKGAELGREGPLRRTALHIAVMGGSKQMVELIIQKTWKRRKSRGSIRWDRDKLGNTALHIAAETGRTAIVDYLAEPGSFTDYENNRKETPLMLAAKQGHEHIVMSLIRSMQILCLSMPRESQQSIMHGNPKTKGYGPG